MASAVQPVMSCRPLHQLILLTVIGFESTRSQNYNFSLMPTSCDSGFVGEVDNIAIIGYIDMEGRASEQTIYNMVVESTSDNQSFTHVCNAIFKSSDCGGSKPEFGCHCNKVNKEGQMLQVLIKQKATEETNFTYYRLRFNSTQNIYQQSMFIEIPRIYGVESSSVELEHKTYTLSKNYRCTLSAETLSRGTNILFCTKNLNTPILTVVFHEEDVWYYVNQECASYFLKQSYNNPGTMLRLGYSDSCNRSQTFMCSIGESTSIGEGDHAVKNSSVLIIVGTAMSMLFFVAVVFSLCSGGSVHEDTSRRSHTRRKRFRHSSGDTSSVVNSSRSVQFRAAQDSEIQLKVRQESLVPMKLRRTTITDTVTMDKISSSSTV